MLCQQVVDASRQRALSNGKKEGKGRGMQADSSSATPPSSSSAPQDEWSEDASPSLLTTPPSSTSTPTPLTSSSSSVASQVTKPPPRRAAKPPKAEKPPTVGRPHRPRTKGARNEETRGGEGGRGEETATSEGFASSVEAGPGRGGHKSANSPVGGRSKLLKSQQGGPQHQPELSQSQQGSGATPRQPEGGASTLLRSQQGQHQPELLHSQQNDVALSPQTLPQRPVPKPRHGDRAATLSNGKPRTAAKREDMFQHGTPHSNYRGESTQPQETLEDKASSERVQPHRTKKVHQSQEQRDRGQQPSMQRDRGQEPSAQRDRGQEPSVQRDRGSQESRGERSRQSQDPELWQRQGSQQDRLDREAAAQGSEGSEDEGEALLMSLQMKAVENDYYGLLHVESGVSAEELSRARRERTRALHPDHYANDQQQKQM